MYLSSRGSLCADSQQAKKAVCTWVRTPPWVSHFSSRIQFPQWQNDSFCENVCSILPAYEKPLKNTKKPYCLDPQDVLESQGLLPSNHS